MTIDRRAWLSGLAAFGAAALWTRGRGALASAANPDDYFVIVHASGGWDVTLWADPRFERVGLVEPASTDNTDIAPLARWTSARLDADTDTFAPLVAGDSKLVLGPGIGDLWDHRARLTVINGLAMNTVSHPDGVAYSTTGRHLAGGRAPAASVDVALASALGATQRLPAVSVQFPSSFVGDRLDRRAIPLRVTSAATIARALARNATYLDAGDRDAVAQTLADETRTLAGRSALPATYERIGAQEDALPALLDGKLAAAFTPKALQDAYPSLPYKAKFQAPGALAAAFAIEAMRRDLVRVVGFSLGGLDTHNQNYKQHAAVQQELFGVIARLLELCDATPHPNRAGAKLADHVHVLVVSDFCRTPQINLAGGRDHYPNNSALVISPRWRGGIAFGATDREQLLPAVAKTFLDGPRPIAPPDVLATFLAGAGVDPRAYLRDGEVVRELLA